MNSLQVGDTLQLRQDSIEPSGNGNPAPAHQDTSYMGQDENQIPDTIDQFNERITVEENAETDIIDTNEEAETDTIDTGEKIEKPTTDSLVETDQPGDAMPYIEKNIGQDTGSQQTTTRYREPEALEVNQTSYSLKKGEPEYIFGRKELTDLKGQNILQNFKKAVKDSFCYVWEPDNVFRYPKGHSAIGPTDKYEAYIESVEDEKGIEANAAMTPDWGTGIIGVIFLLIIWSRLRFRKYFSLLLRGPYSYSLSVGLHYDNNSNLMKLSFLMNMVFVMTLGLFLTLIMQYYSIKPLNYNYLLYFVVLSVAIALLYQLKAMVCHFTGLIFSSKNIFREYIHHFFLLNKNLGIYLFPMVIMLHFVQYEKLYLIIYFAIGIIVAFYIIRFIRGIQIIFRNRISIFYMILYLCILEALPILVGLHAIRSLL